MWSVNRDPEIWNFDDSVGKLLKWKFLNSDYSTFTLIICCHVNPFRKGLSLVLIGNDRVIMRRFYVFSQEESTLQ